jgi:hypothetical protein
MTRNGAEQQSMRYETAQGEGSSSQQGRRGEPFPQDSEFGGHKQHPNTQQQHPLPPLPSMSILHQMAGASSSAGALGQQAGFAGPTFWHCGDPAPTLPLAEPLLTHPDHAGGPPLPQQQQAPQQHRRQQPPRAAKEAAMAAAQQQAAAEGRRARRRRPTARRSLQAMFDAAGSKTSPSEAADSGSE